MKKKKKKALKTKVGKDRDKRKKKSLIQRGDMEVTEKDYYTPGKTLRHKTLQSYKFICFEINTNTSLRNFS